MSYAVLLLSLGLMLLLAGYLYWKTRALARDLEDFKESSAEFMTYDEWDEAVKPSLAELEEKTDGLKRQMTLMAANLRSMQQQQSRLAGKAGLAEKEETAPSGDYEEVASDVDYDRSSGPEEEAEGGITDNNLQAMLRSMARLIQGDPCEEQQQQFFRASLVAAASPLYPPQETEVPRPRIVDVSEEDEDPR